MIGVNDLIGIYMRLMNYDFVCLPGSNLDLI
jgi:hypothetical protein